MTAIDFILYIITVTYAGWKSRCNDHVRLILSLNSYSDYHATLQLSSIQSLGKPKKSISTFYDFISILSALKNCMSLEEEEERRIRKPDHWKLRDDRFRMTVYCETIVNAGRFVERSISDTESVELHHSCKRQGCRASVKYDSCIR